MPVLLLPLSAHEPALLAALAGRYAALLAGPGAPDVIDVCFTAAHCSDHRDHRLAVVGSTADELGAGLLSAIRGEPARGVATGSRTPGDDASVVFVFAGQGPQWCGIGQDLLRSEPVFAEAIAACDAAMRPHAPWRLLEELAASEDRTRLGETEIAQPLLFALQMGLAALWREWGVEPAAVIGHSHGEIAAAHSAGILDLETASRIAVARGRLMQRATGIGAMAALTIDASEAEHIAADSRGLLSVAAMNGPRSVVLSGDSKALGAALASLAVRGIGHTKLPVDSARHSAQMEPIRKELERELGGMKAGSGTIPLYSTVTGTLHDGRAMNAAYWGRNVRDTVRFTSAIQTAAARGLRTFVEISPSPALRWHIEESLVSSGGGRVATSLRRGRTGRSALLAGAAELYAAGASLRWKGIQPNGREVDVPLHAAEPHLPAAAPHARRVDFMSLEPGERRAAIARAVRDEVAAILELPTAGDVDPARNFFAAGMDSLMAVELKSRLERAVLPSLPPNLTFSHPSANALVEYLTEAIATRANSGDGIAHSSPGASPMRRLPRDGDLPLSFGQERVWFLEQLQPESLAYNSLRRIGLSGVLDSELLRKSVEAIVARHEVLRATFPSVDGAPVERIGPSIRWPMPLIDLRTLQEVAREDEASRLTRAAAKTPFDLATGPLVRTLLVRMTDERHILVLTIHHIISDEWSTDLFLRELAAFYDGFLTKAPPALAELPVQYADFAQWQREWLTGDIYESYRAYWADKLAGPLPTLELPSDGPVPAETAQEGRTRNSSIDATVLRGLRDFSRREGVTLYTTLLAALSVLLHRYTAQDDVVVGSYVAGRSRNEVDPLIGFFVNTLALRTDLSGDPTFRDALLRTRDVVLGAQAHADFPYEKLVEELRPERNLRRNPFFQVDFNLHGYRAGAESVSSGLRFESLPYLEYHATTDGLTFTAFDRKDTLDLAITYDPQLFDAQTVARLDAHFNCLLAGIVANPDMHVSTLPLSSPSERRLLLVDFNSSEVTFPGEKCFPGYFEEQVRRTPDAIAVEDDAGTLTYAELNARANSIAGKLVAAGVGPDRPVALFGERGRMLLTWILATFKAGGVYLPLDPRHPPSRHASILLQSGTAVALVADELRAQLDEAVVALPARSRPRTFTVGDLAEDAVAAGDLPPRSHPDDLAYIIFTSGSTGSPKGAMVPHRAMLNHFWSKVRWYGIAPTDVILQSAPQAFDISIWQLLAGLLAGARIRIAADVVAAEPERLFSLIEQAGVTIAEMVPSFLRAYLDEPARTPRREVSLDHLRWLMLGAETLSPELCRRWFVRHRGTPVVNAYGPSECADDVTRHAITDGPGDNTLRVPIGRPIDNVRVYIVDQHLALSPHGVVGELCVGGACVGRGYVNDPERTAASFVADPFTAAPGARMYRTGDRARFRHDGTIEFLGRADRQVKIRGHRIELGEIEGVIERHPGVRESVVRVWPGPQGPRLVAYVVVVDPAKAIVDEDLRAHVRTALPAYMAPDSFIALAALPLSPNGKLDRNALPAPELPPAAGAITPRTDAEATVARIWAEALGVERVGIHDNFFALGGHSLIAARVASRLREAFGFDVPLRRMFELQTVVELAARLAMDAASAPAGERPSIAGTSGGPTLGRASREAFRRTVPPDNRSSGNGEPA